MSLHIRPNAGSSQKTVDCLWITLLWAVPPLVLPAFQNVPLIDDWTYAWSVQRLLERGELSILAWSTQLNFVQVLWGALFSLPFGFSFSALRIATWATALACLWGLYLMLRELRVSRRDSLIGTALLAVNPVFFVLSFSFMTDVPFVALTVWAAYAAIRALRLRDGRWLCAAASFTCLATGVRVPALVIAPAMACTLLFDSGLWGRRSGRVLVSLVPVLFFGVLAAWALTHTQQTVDLSEVDTAPANKIRMLRYALPALPKMLLADANCVAPLLGLWMLPLAAAAAQRTPILRPVRFALLLASSLAAGVFLDLPFSAPLSNGLTWSATELASTREFVPGYEEPLLPWWWMAGAVAFSLASASILLAASRQRMNRGRSFLLWLVAWQFLAIAGLWLFYDRYVLVLLPLAIALFLTGRPRLRPGPAVALVCLFAAVSIVGLADRVDFDRALWSAVEDLRSRGARESEIDGGYIVNGWLQYAHPENAPRDERGELVVPGLTRADFPLRYTIANRPLPGRRVIGTIPYRQRLRDSGELFLLEIPSRSS